MVGEQHHTSEIQQVSFLLILAAVTFMLVWISWPFATSLLWSALAAIMFQPLYKWSVRICRGKRNMAATLSLLIILFAVLLPALWIGGLVVQEALAVIAVVQAAPPDFNILFEQVFTVLPSPVQEWLTQQQFDDFSDAQARLQQFLTESAGVIASQAVSIGSGALGFFLAFGLGLYVTYFLLRDGSRIGETILHSAPVERAIADRLAGRFLGIVRATIKGSGVVGLVQGFLGTVTFMIAGVPSALLFGVLMAILSLIPAVGTGLVWAPVGIWLLFSGAVWQGIFVLVSGFLIIGMADNVLRPILVGRDTGIPDWIILVTTLGGISLVGLSGIVLGPLVAGLFLASWSILQEQRAQDEEMRQLYAPKIGSDGKVLPPGVDPDQMPNEDV